MTVAAQIRPNRLEVTDRFPMLGFTIRTDGIPQRAEVVVATDPSLFLAQNKGARSLSNFYSSRATGPLPVPRGEGVYVVPAEVLARFVGQERLYVGLATAPERNGQSPRIDVLPGAASPYVSLRGLTGRSLRRMRVLPTRQYRTELYAARDRAALEWAGDSVPAAPATNGSAGGSANGVTPTPAPVPADYDDGFGPLVAPAAPSPSPVAATPSAPAGSSTVSNGAAPAAAAGFGTSSFKRPAITRGRALDLSSLSVGSRQAVSPPSITRLPDWQAGLAKGALSALAGPLAPALVVLPAAAGSANVSIGIGPAVSGALGGGVGLGVGLVFGPDGGVGVYGAAEFEIGFIASISAVAQVTVVSGGIESFNGWGYAAAISGGEGIVGGAAALFDAGGNFQGVSFQLGVGVGLTPVDFYIAVQRQVATTLALAQAARGVRPPLPTASAAQRALALAAEIPLDPGNGGMSVGADALEIGDVIVSTTAAAVSRGIRFATGSQVSHAMLYVGQGGQVIDATGEGARLRPLAEAIGDASLAVAFRRPGLSDAQKQIIADRAAEYIGRPYNYWGIVRQARFQMHSLVCDLLPEAQANACRRFVGYVDLGRGSGREFFCSELVIAAFDAAGVALTDTPPNWTTPDDLAQLSMAAGVLAYVGHLKAPPYDARPSLWDSLGLAMAAVPAGRRPPIVPVRATGHQPIVRVLSSEPSAFRFPPVRALSGLERQLANAFFSAVSTSFAPLGAARSLAHSQGLSIAIGPAVSAGFGVGAGAGVGVIFAPGDQVGVYGQVDLRAGLIDSVSAEVQVTVVRGGVDAFSGISLAAAVEVDLGVSVSAQALFDSSMNFQGVTFGLGVGIGLEPVQVFFSVQAGTSTALARMQSLGPRALATEPFTINWDEVQLIAQAPEMNCWTTAAASIIGWRDRVGLTPETVTQIASRTQVTGQDIGQVAQFANEIGLVVEPRRAYSADDVRALLERRGPVWVAAPDTAHAVTVTGAYADSGQMLLRVTDPMDREVGTPGAPGARSGQSSTGSRYIVRWDDFGREFGTANADGTVVLDVLHAGGTAGRTPNRGPATGAGYAQGLARIGRGLTNESFSVNWDEVEAVAQPTNSSCWAAAGAMVVGWRDRVSLSPDSLAAICNRTTVTGLPPAQVGAFAAELGLVAEPPLCYSVDALRQLLEAKGPLWVGAAIPGLHVVVVTGLYGDSGANTFVRITDPLDRETGTPGAPGRYLGTHVTGSRYIMRWDDFVNEYEAAAINYPAVNLQILHSGGTNGRTPNYGSAASAGYAQAVSRVVGRQMGRSFDAADAVAPPQRRQEAGSSESVQWLLDQCDGLRQPATPDPTVTASGTRTVRLDDWPLLKFTEGQVQLPMSVAWQYERGAIGNVRVTPEVMHTLPGWTLSVSATIENGPDAPGVAAATLRVRNVFVHGTEPPIVAVTEMTLFGDGTYQRRDRWERAAA